MTEAIAQLLEQPRLRNMARVALRLPNDKMLARENFVRITLAAGHKTWGDFVEAGLARKRKPESGASDKVAVYELTEGGISAVLEDGEKRGDVTVSPEADLVSLDGTLGVTPAAAENETQPAVEAKPEAEPNILSIDKVVKVPEGDNAPSAPSAPDSLEASVLRVASSDEVPEWARKVILDLWRDINKMKEAA